eukprot:2268200-Pyramimonas_sp.AAC.1
MWGMRRKKKEARMRRRRTPSPPPTYGGGGGIQAHHFGPVSKHKTEGACQAMRAADSHGARCALRGG